MVELSIRKRPSPGVPILPVAATGSSSTALLLDEEDLFAQCFSDLSRRSPAAFDPSIRIAGPTLGEVRQACKEHVARAREQHQASFWGFRSAEPSSEPSPKATAAQKLARAKARATHQLQAEYQRSVAQLQAAEARRQARAHARAQSLAQARQQAQTRVEREYLESMSKLERRLEHKERKRALAEEARELRRTKARMDATVERTQLQEGLQAQERALSHPAERQARRASARQARAQALARAREHASVHLAHLLGPHSYYQAPEIYLAEPLHATSKQYHSSTTMLEAELVFGWEEKCGLFFIGLILTAAGIAVFNVLLRPKALNRMDPLQQLEDFSKEANVEKNSVTGGSMNGSRNGSYSRSRSRRTRLAQHQQQQHAKTKEDRESPPVNAISITSSNSSFLTGSYNNNHPNPTAAASHYQAHNTGDDHSASGSKADSHGSGSHSLDASHHSRGSHSSVGSCSRHSNAHFGSPKNSNSNRSHASTAAGTCPSTDRALIEQRQAAIARSRLQQPTSTLAKKFQTLQSTKTQDPLVEQKEKENDLDEIREALRRYYKSYERRNARRASHHSRSNSMSSNSTTIRMPLPSMHEEPVLEENEDEEPDTVSVASSHYNSSSYASYAEPLQPLPLMLFKPPSLSSHSNGRQSSTGSAGSTNSDALLEYNNEFNNGSHGSGSLVMPQRRLSQGSDASSAKRRKQEEDDEVEELNDSQNIDNQLSDSQKSGGSQVMPLLPQRRPSFQASVQMSEITYDDHHHDMHQHHGVASFGNVVGGRFGEKDHTRVPDHRNNDHHPIMHQTVQLHSHAHHHNQSHIEMGLSNHSSHKSPMHHHHHHHMSDISDMEDEHDLDENDSQESTVSHFQKSVSGGDNKPRVSPMSLSRPLPPGVAIGIPVGGSNVMRASPAPIKPPTALTVTVVKPSPNSTSHKSGRSGFVSSTEPRPQAPTMPAHPPLFSITKKVDACTIASKADATYASSKADATATTGASSKQDDDSESQGDSTSASSMENHFPDPVPSDDDKEDTDVPVAYVSPDEDVDESNPTKPIFSMDPKVAPPIQLPRWVAPGTRVEFPNGLPATATTSAKLVSVKTYTEIAADSDEEADDADDESENHNRPLSEDDDIMSTRSHYSNLTAPSVHHLSLQEWEDSLKERTQTMMNSQSFTKIEDQQAQAVPGQNARSDSDDSCPLKYSDSSSGKEDNNDSKADNKERSDTAMQTPPRSPSPEPVQQEQICGNMQQVHRFQEQQRRMERATNRTFSGSETSSPTSVRSLYTNESDDEMNAYAKSDDDDDASSVLTTTPV